MDTVIPILTSVAIVVATLAVCLWRTPSIAPLLLLALFVRLAATAVHVWAVALPDSAADATTFLSVAKDMAYAGPRGLLQSYPGSSPYLYSWILGWVFAIFGTSDFLAHTINISLGVVIVKLTYDLAAFLWGRDAALSAGFLAAVFPALVQYSVLTMREPFIACAFIVAVISVVRFISSGNLRQLPLAAVAIATAGMFHSAMFIALIPVLITVVVYGRSAAVGGKLALTILFGVGIFAAPVLFYVYSGISLPYVGNIESITSEEMLLQRIEARSRGSMSYPQWLTPTGFGSAVILAAPRLIYFMLGPFPWDIRALSQALASVDALFYWALALFLWLNRRALLQSRSASGALTLVILMMFVYSLGTSNFGAAIRHRAKFAPVLIALAAPMLPCFSRDRRSSGLSTPDHHLIKSRWESKF